MPSQGADHAEGEADQDRREGRPTWPLCHLPARGGRSVPCSVHEDSAADCRPGGAALFCPDYTSETFRSSTRHGGHDVVGRGMRYLEWDWDPDPTDTTYITDFAYLLRDETGEVRCEYDRHILGLFRCEDWLRLITDVGFQARIIHPEDRESESETPVFLGIRQNL